MPHDRSEDGFSALAHRVMERCDILAGFSEETNDRLTRTFLSPPMRQVHTVLSEWMRASGMTVRVDAAGNLIGQYLAASEPAPVLLIGSHLDTVPNAGKFDGILGVLLALAVVESLSGKALPFALEVIGFSEEEGVRFQTPYLGSRAVIGDFDPALLQLHDRNGIRMEESIRDFGLNPDAITDAAYLPGQILGYLEAHIEQGPVLETQRLPVGVVSAIAGQSRLRLRFIGHAAHAGTTPMGLRRDALAGVAEWISAVEKLGEDTPGLVATVGKLSLEPNTANVIPGSVEVSLDVRHADDTLREMAVNQLLDRAESIARRRRLEWETLQHQSFPAVAMEANLRCALIDAIEKTSGTPAIEMVSGAGHDAAIMASAFPSAMLFLRSPNGGISHHPDETVWVEDIEVALRVLCHAVCSYA